MAITGYDREDFKVGKLTPRALRPPNAPRAYDSAAKQVSVKGSLAPEAALVRPGDHDLRARDRPNPRLREQRWRQRPHERFELALQLAFLPGEGLGSPSERAQGDKRAVELCSL